MKVNTEKTKITIKLLLVLFLTVSYLFNLSLVNAAYEDAPTVVLTINDGEADTINIIDGELIKLGWYVDGNVANCSIIGPGLETVVTTEEINALPGNLPTFGFKEIVPPAGEAFNYALICEGGSDSGTVVVDPVVTLTFPDGNDFDTSPETGEAPEADSSIRVSWNSEYANQCRDLYYTEGADPTKIYIINGLTTISGTVTIGYGSDIFLTEDTTFYITCSNTTSGVSTLGSGEITVTQIAPPSSVTVDASGDASATRDVLTAWAYADVSWTSTGASSCTVSAKYVDGSSYPTGEPKGWWSFWDSTSAQINNIKLSTTTDFVVTCTRPAMTVNSVFYPAVSASDTHRVAVVNPVGVPEDLSLWDRHDQPQVTATILADPETVYKDPVTGYAHTKMYTTQTNAEYCLQYAYKTNGTEDTGDDTAYYLYNWTTEQQSMAIRDASWNPNLTTLQETTRLVRDCQREWDLLYGDDIAKALGRAIVETTVNVEESLVVTDPETHMYAHVVSYTPESLSADETAVVTGFQKTTGSGYFKSQFRNTTSATNFTNSLTWDFAHPMSDVDSEAEDNFDIVLNLCDLSKNGAEATYNVYINGVLEGTYVTDKDTFSLPDWCDGVQGSTLSWVMIADEVSVTNGDEIKLECVENVDGENCSFANISFGVDGTVTTKRLDFESPTNRTNVKLGWFSENTTTCSPLPITYKDASTEDWVPPSSDTSQTAFLASVAGSSTVGVRCSRSSDGEYQDSLVTLVVPGKTLIVDDISGASGECVDSITALSRAALPGEVADTSNGNVCIIGSDMGVNIYRLEPYGDTDYLVSNLDINRAEGTYTNLKVIFSIQNVYHPELGYITIPEGNKSYVSSLGIDPAIKQVYEEDEGLIVFSTSTSVVGNYNPEIAPAEGIEEGTSLILESTLSGEIMFGRNHSVCVGVNLDGTPNMPELLPKDNNLVCVPLNLPVPRPLMDVSVGRPFVRAGESATITWDIDANYNLECSIKGAGGLNQKFTTKFDNGIDEVKLFDSNTETGTFETAPLTNASRYVLSCTEPITDTTFTSEAIVEVIPEQPEI